MKDLIEIKSAPYGITVVLNPDRPFDQELIEICSRFHDNRAFFGKAALVLTIDGRRLNPDEVRAVVQSVEYNSDVRISVVHIGAQFMDVKEAEAVREYMDAAVTEHALIHRGDVKDGETVQSASSLVVIGDALSGSTLKASGNIIVTGTLSGDAEAGFPTRGKCFIYAGKILATSFSIGGYEGDLPAEKGLFRWKKKKVPGEILLFRNDHFILTNPSDEGFLKQKKN